MDSADSMVRSEHATSSRHDLSAPSRPVRHGVEEMPQAVETAPNWLGATPCPLHLSPILLCGAPRTGTSWTAKVLSKGGNIRYFREPFSHGGFARDHGVAWYSYLRAGDEVPEYESAWRRVFSFEPFLSRRWLMADSRGWLQRTPFWPARLLIKEVLCPLSLDWLTQRFPLSVLITIRHPCGYVASGLRLHKAGEVALELFHLRSQAALMAEFPEGLREWIMGLEDPVAQLAAAYGIVYKILGDQMEAHPEWLLIHHETLCRDPGTSFRRLCRASISATRGRWRSCSARRPVPAIPPCTRSNESAPRSRRNGRMSSPRPRSTPWPMSSRGSA